MSTPIMINVSDEALRKAEQVARTTGRSLADVLAETLDSSLSLFEPSLEDRLPVNDMSSDEVLAQADSVMDHELAERHRVLLDRQQAGLLTEAENVELQGLLNVYQVGQLRKAQAMAEAVKRGLREPGQ